MFCMHMFSLGLIYVREDCQRILMNRSYEEKED